MLTNTKGFTLVELMISMVILTVAILGIAVSAGRLSTAAGEAEIKALAVQAAEDRMSLILLDPMYDSLGSRYVRTESTVLGLPGVSRETMVNRFQITQASGKVLDYTRLTVQVTGSGIQTPIVRESVVGAP